MCAIHGRSNKPKKANSAQYNAARDNNKSIIKLIGGASLVG